MVRTVYAEDNPAVLQLVLAVIHPHYTDCPDTIDLDTLWQVTALQHKYDIDTPEMSQNLTM
jgi:hypothetical protein